MPATLDQKSATKLLRAHGWKKERGGKHETKMTKEGHRPITLPKHNGGDYSPWLRHQILKQAGIAEGGDSQGGGS